MRLVLHFAAHRTQLGLQTFIRNMAATTGTGTGRDFRGRAFSVDRDMTGLVREFPRNSRGSAE